MTRLEPITIHSTGGGIRTNSAVTIEHTQVHGIVIFEITSVDEGGRPSPHLLFRDQERQRDVVQRTRSLFFSANGALLKL